MNSDTSAVQCGKAPELILLSKCHILTKDIFQTSPSTGMETAQSPWLQQVWQQCSVLPLQRICSESSRSSHTVQHFHFSNWNNAFTSQSELHPNIQETANERADDHLVGGKNTPHFLDIQLQSADAPQVIKEHQRCCACSHTVLRTQVHTFLYNSTTRLYSDKQQNKQIKALKNLQLHFTTLTITRLVTENWYRNLQFKRYRQLISKTVLGWQN